MLVEIWKRERSAVKSCKLWVVICDSAYYLFDFTILSVLKSPIQHVFLHLGV